MKKRSASKEVAAILISIFFIIVGFVAIWFSKAYLGVEGEALFIFLLLAPILTYAIFSGRLTELKAGGMEAKFADIGEQTVDVGSETIDPSANDMEIVEKDGARKLQRTLDSIDKSKPIILTLTLGREGFFNQRVWLNYVESLSQFGNFKFVVLLDKKGHFIAYLSAWAMLQILKNSVLGDAFVDIVNNGLERELKLYPGVMTKAISTKTTNLEALKEMASQNIGALVVIDEGRKLCGVVEREQILSKLLIGMAK
jgi:CBS domain-containing protein